MKNQTLLLMISDATTDDEVRGYAAIAATQNARLICLMLSIAPTYPISTFGAMPYSMPDVSADWIDKLNASRRQVKIRAAALKELLQAEGAAGDIQVVQCSPVDIRDVVARRALVCDMAFVSDSLRSGEFDIFQSACYGVLFDSPAPLLINTLPHPRPERIFVAWNNELPAAQAIHAALPMLKSATDVFIGCFDPVPTETQDGEDPGADLAKWLSHHGCEVTVNQFPSGDGDIGASIQRRALEIGADLVVMGAFGRSRLRQLVFGGTTRSMLSQTETPVLMAH